MLEYFATYCCDWINYAEQDDIVLARINIFHRLKYPSLDKNGVYSILQKKEQHNSCLTRCVFI